MLYLKDCDAMIYSPVLNIGTRQWQVGIIEDHTARPLTEDECIVAANRLNEPPTTNPVTCPHCHGNGITIDMSNGAPPYTYPTCIVCMGERVVWRRTP
jgi:hypothetical protein